MRERSSFPGANPHPVMRIDDDGRLIYANDAERAAARASSGVDGRRRDASDMVDHGCRRHGPIDLRVGPRTFELLAVRLPDLGFTNVYGMDVTARAGDRQVPGPEPEPGLPDHMGRDLVYVNAGSAT